MVSKLYSCDGDGGVCVVFLAGTVARVPYWEADMIGYDSGRRLRTSAIFTRSEPFAVFGQTMAYERPLYFHTDSLVDEEAESAWTLPKPASIHGIKTCMQCFIAFSVGIVLPI